MVDRSVSSKQRLIACTSLTVPVYHIHNNTVNSSGNCTSAGGILNPYNVTLAFVCDPAKPQFCQVGDLSGKHGNLTTSNASAAYASQ